MARFGRLQAALYDPLMRSADAGWMGALRDQVVGGAGGDTLEVGAGTGLNLVRYRVPHKVVMAEPEPAMIRHLQRRLGEAQVPVTVVQARGERLPFDDASFDTVISTLVLCSVTDVAHTLAEIRRVLRPGGRYRFLEHGGSDDPRLAGWQRRLEPVWKRVAGGCHLTRDAARLIQAAGFTLDEVHGHGPARTGPMKPFRVGAARVPSDA